MYGHGRGDMYGRGRGDMFGTGAGKAEGSASYEATDMHGNRMEGRFLSLRPTA